MRLVKIDDLLKSYSFFLPEKRPTEAWAVSFSTSSDKNQVGIPGTILNQVHEMSSKWAGWAFCTFSNGDTEAMLLFESKEDAVLAKVTFGETHVD